MSREPSVYVLATMESVLEKKSLGVLRSKAKVKCWLHGSTLYEQKDQDVKLFDMCEAQTVRRVANDTSGTQFEIIIKKKTHTYICPSAEECKKWVSALQKCMMLKETRDSNAKSLFYMEEDCDTYATIGESTTSTPSVSSQSSETLVAPDADVEKVYCTPYDAVECPPHTDNDYEDVQLRKSSYVSEITNGENSHSSEEAEYTDGISTSDPVPDPIDGLTVLSEAFLDCETPTDDLPHTIKTEDISCLKNLKDFLKANKAYYTPSILKESKADDPLAALKSCLESLKVC